MDKRPVQEGVLHLSPNVSCDPAPDPPASLKDKRLYLMDRWMDENGVTTVWQ